MAKSSSGSMPPRTLRIIDANLNRIGEGLRFLEEVARLMLDDVALTQRLKDLRHEMVRGELAFHRRLLQARDAEGDVGADLEASGEPKHRDMPVAVIANSRRVQESLRVLEELAKLPDSGLDPHKFQKARFALYAIEKALLARLESSSDRDGGKSE